MLDSNLIAPSKVPALNGIPAPMSLKIKSPSDSASCATSIIALVILLHYMNMNE